MTFSEFLSLDLPPLLTSVFAAVACAIPGNYLVLRRLSLMGDAISHSVLPGIVIAFLLTSSRGSFVIFLGAAVAGILSVILIEVIRKYGQVETGASMGVVFSIFFALGIFLIERVAARNIDLDADCLLHGQVEGIFWYPPENFTEIFSFDTFYLLPGELYISFFTLLVVVAFVWLFYKELKITSFDPALATSLGFSSAFFYQLLMVLTACAVVASFKVVGSILSIAMILCPAATARLYTDRLIIQIFLSIVIAIFSVTFGYFLGAFAPMYFNYPHSLSVSGMMTVIGGIALMISAFLAPKYGLIARGIRKFILALSIRQEDILAMLYRYEEMSQEKLDKKTLFTSKMLSTFGTPFLTTIAFYLLRLHKAVLKSGNSIMLSISGKAKASKIIRTHRLWENYLVGELSLKPDHVHQTAEALEHYSQKLLEEQARKTGIPNKDPHGKPIPK